MKKRLLNLSTVQASIFLLMPLLFMGVTGQKAESISAYYYLIPSVFVLSLTLAGAMFFYGGILDKTKWYNIIIAIGLFGVALTPHLDYPIIHYISAFVFFAGSNFNMVYFSSDNERRLKKVVAIIVIFGMIGHFVFSWYSLLWAEWFGMIPISFHYILETNNKID